MEEYIKVSEQIYRQVLEQQVKLKNAKPNTNSQFLKEYDKLKQMGGSTFATLYTGGVLSLTHQQYKELYNKYYTKDICNGAILAFTEICPNSIGVRLYFEFDYRSWIRLPTEEEMINHVKMAQTLVKEAFPQEEKNDPTCHVAKCTPKIKFAAASKNEKGKLAIGTHIIFAQIILNTLQLRQLIATLDARMTLENSFFSGTVDAASVHRESASLRPLYAYRLDQCDGCYPSRKKRINPPPNAKKKSASANIELKTKYIENEKQWTKNNDLISLEKENYESDSEEDIGIEEEDAACKQDCIKGKKFASPSIYKPWFILLEDGKTLEYFDEDTDDKKEWIEDTSIIPPFGLGFNNYHKPKDAVDIENIIVKHGNSIILKSEKSLFTPKLKTGLIFDSQSHTEILNAVTKIIHDFDPEHYSEVRVNYALYTQRSCSMLVALKPGLNYKFCLLKDACHGNNNVFFTLKFKSKKKNKSEIRFFCQAPQCIDILRNYHSKSKNTKNKNLIVVENEIGVTPLQKLLLCKTSKEIPFQLRKEVLNLLNIKCNNESEKEFFEEEKQLLLLNEDSKPAKFMYDARIGSMVLEQELSLPIPTKKRNYEELGCFFENSEHSKPKKIPEVEVETSRLEKEQTFDFLLDELLNE